MSMYLGRIQVRASLPVNYGLLYWAFISGLHVIDKWKMCSVPKIVLVGVLGTGVPRLACLRPTAWLSQQAVRPIFISKASKTLARGQASQGG